MKSFFSLIAILAMSFFLISCSDNSDEIHQQHATPDTVDVDYSKIADMMLNNGKKWQMDEHTRSILAAMKVNITSLDLSSSTTEELQALGNKLTLQLDSLIQGCTMVDAEHDQLHIFLTGYIPALNELTETGCIESAEKVNYYLNNYSNYFE
ncbi:MAG: hypothetical protein COA63_012550 [Methylophaga sp.]|nr:hypothetical protein [Methylophaga sp.]